MNAPQIAILGIFFIDLLLAAHNSGKEKTGKHSFIVELISTAIFLWLLSWGGFFDK